MAPARPHGLRLGKGWARIVSTVFFGIGPLSALASVGTGLGGGATRIYGRVVWVIGLVAVILLWPRPSSGYFLRAPRY